MSFRAGHFNETPDYHTVRPRGASDWLMILTVSGRGRHRHDGSNYPLDPRRALLYPPGVPQDYGTDPAAGSWELVWCHFDSQSRFAGLLKWPSLPGGAMVVDLGGPYEPALKALSEVAKWHREPGPRSNDFGLNALERALLWCDTANPRSSRHVAEPRVSEAMEYIARRFAQQIAVPAVAAHVGLSPSRLSHLFRRHTGKSVPVFLEEIRLEQSLDLLRMTSRRVSEIAFQVGYTDPLYFSKRFRLRYRASPTRWRRARQ